jgi:hypothetical protein
MRPYLLGLCSLLLATGVFAASSGTDYEKSNYIAPHPGLGKPYRFDERRRPIRGDSSKKKTRKKKKTDEDARKDKWAEKPGKRRWAPKSKPKPKRKVYSADEDEEEPEEGDAGEFSEPGGEDDPAINTGAISVDENAKVGGIPPASNSDVKFGGAAPAPSAPSTGKAQIAR